MTPDPELEIESLLSRLEGVASILYTLGTDIDSSDLIVLADVTKGIAKGNFDRLHPDP